MYSISLFLHIVGALGIFATLAVEHAAQFSLRRARTSSQAREWLSLLRAQQRIQGPSAFVLLATGLYMMATHWSHQAWAGLGLVGMVLMATLGAAITGRRMRAIARAIPEGDAPLTATMREQLDDAAIRASASVRLALALGLVFNMSVKPAAGAAVIVLVTAMVAGVIAAQLSRVSASATRRAAVQE